MNVFQKFRCLKFYQKWRMSEKTDDVVGQEELVDGGAAVAAFASLQHFKNTQIDANPNKLKDSH